MNRDLEKFRRQYVRFKISFDRRRRLGVTFGFSRTKLAFTDWVGNAITYEDMKSYGMSVINPLSEADNSYIEYRISKEARDETT